jgi:hypothetical protein
LFKNTYTEDIISRLKIMFCERFQTVYMPIYAVIPCWMLQMRLLGRELSLNLLSAGSLWRVIWRMVPMSTDRYMMVYLSIWVLHLVALCNVQDSYAVNGTILFILTRHYITTSGWNM